MPWILPTLPVLGLIAMAMSLSHLLPLAVSLFVDDGMSGIFGGAMAINFAIGFLLWALTRSQRR
ncbi:MAG TPA: TrkH family potassium uptake protein, partial [Burkholderiales bacterium]|nr:TrkH family potassium uptake protein [Burkholderiales bacterium]